MRSGGWFGEIAKSLRDGFFADRVILALAKAQRNGGTIPEESKELFVKTSMFLRDAITGYGWIDKPSFSSDSANHASLFGQALRAMEISSASSDFIVYLTELKATADEIAAGRSPGNSQLTKLRAFFVSHSTAEMQHSNELSEMGKKRGELAWGILGR
ncbi:hypothetical protein KKG05_03835 [bacterium]|nr:hypothetical protein [bacterium]